ncbi:diguanylate cyclase [Chloroflexota bacterium]
MNPWALIPLLSCVAYLVLLAFALRKFKKSVNRAFALFLFASFAWCLCTTFLSINKSASSSYLIFWNNMVLVGVVWSYVSFYHFARVFTGRAVGFFTYCIYVLPLTVLALSFGSYVVRDAWIVNGHIYHDIGPWVYILMTIVLPSTVIPFWMLIKKYRALKDDVERNRIKYLLVGLVIIGFWGPFNANVPLLATLPTDHLGTLANAIIIGFVIRKYKLLDIGFVARRALAYSLLLVVIITVYIGGLYFAIIFSDSLSAIALLLAVSALSLLLYHIVGPIKYFIEYKVDRIFQHNTYAYRQALIEFNLKITNTIELDEVANEMLHTLGRVLRLTHAELLLQDSDNFTTYFTYPKAKVAADDKLTINQESAIALWLAKENKPLSVANMSIVPGLEDVLTEEDSKLADPRLAFLLPIVSHEKMIGILALGHRQIGRVFHPEDIELAAVITKQAGIVIENAQLYTQAKQRANIDELTGLFNHRHFHQRLDEEIERSSRFGDVFSLLMIDLDFFKTYNDIHGHLYGDNILKRIGESIENNSRAIDVPARYGGDEFAMVLPKTSIAAALEIAERLRSVVESETSFKGVTVTCSIGVASWPTDGFMKEDLLQSTDIALYYAKKVGRNRVCVASKLSTSDLSKQSRVQDNNGTVLNTIYALAATVDAKDHYTYGHSKKVSKYASDIAAELGYSEEKISTIRTSGLLHDIGKIGISDKIILKNTALNEEEWELIRTHPTMGVSILKHVESIRDCLPSVQYHHERYDGTGYPQGLKGENIPLDARILAVADAFDAMTSSRPYRNQIFTRKEAMEELIRCAGIQFDLKIVKSFIKILSRSGSKQQVAVFR